MKVVRVRFVWVAAIGLAVSSCDNAEPAVGDRVGQRPDVADDIRPDNAAEWTMACENGQGLVVTFDHPRQMATVRRSDGMAFDLIRASTSAGYRYQATQTALEGQGKTAKWSAPRVSGTTCRVTEVKPDNQP